MFPEQPLEISLLLTKCVHSSSRIILVILDAKLFELFLVLSNRNKPCKYSIRFYFRSRAMWTQMDETFESVNRMFEE